MLRSASDPAELSFAKLASAYYNAAACSFDTIAIHCISPTRHTETFFHLLLFAHVSFEPFCGSDSVIACADARGKQLRNGGGGASCAQDAMNK